MKTIYGKKSRRQTHMKFYWNWPRRFFFLFLTVNIVTSCSDFIAIDSPTAEIGEEMVFSTDNTAISAMDAVYNNLQYTGFSSGRPYSVTLLSGTSADLLINYTSSTAGGQFFQNTVIPDNLYNRDMWISFYKRIYEVNSILEGVANSNGLSEMVKRQLEGEAKFIRAFSYFYLVNLYRRVPLITTTEYQTNAIMPQSEPSEIYEQIIADLLESELLLDNDYHGDLRTRINKGTVRALLARVYLFMENWNQAEIYATMVIDNPLYALLQDLDQVFLMDSKETIWHLLPVDPNYNTYEGYYLILTQTPETPSTQFSYALSDSFLSSFEITDMRRQHWIEELETTPQSYYYPFKYKIKQDGNLSEYSVVLRLAEQYLIRAEARAMQNNLTDAIADLDVIRGRADLPLIADINPGIDRQDLLTAIWEERKKELFAEWGHRWMDLKRTGRIDVVLSKEKPNWQSYQAIFPIPEYELLNNPSLNPTDGYAY